MQPSRLQPDSREGHSQTEVSKRASQIEPQGPWLPTINTFLSGSHNPCGSVATYRYPEHLAVWVTPAQVRLGLGATGMPVNGIDSESDLGTVTACPTLAPCWQA